MALIRCASCRYSFEHLANEPPTECPQCGGRSLGEDAPKPGHHREDKPTIRIKTIPKPEE